MEVTQPRRKHESISVDDMSRICESIALHGVHGVWSHIAAFLLLMAVVWGHWNVFPWVSTAAGLVLFLALMRWILLRLRHRWTDSVWLFRYSMVLVLTTSAWGVMLGYLLAVEGRNSSVSVPVMLIMTGIAAGAQTAVSSYRRLHTYYQITLWVPPSIGGLLPYWHKPDLVPFALFMLFLGYLLVQGSNYHKEFLISIHRERELERARLAAESASQAKSAFVANISHEIRTPMNGLLGMLELSLLDDIQDSHRDTLSAAKSSAQALLGLLNDLLDFSKLEAGRMQLEVIPVDLAQLAAEVVRLFQAQADAKGVGIRAVLRPNTDAVLADPTRLRQVLINLLGNAIKFTERGEVTVEIEVGKGDPAAVTFRVRDTGIGIPDSAIAAIFEAFTQASKDTSRKYGGTGLGLAICQRLVNMMGGELRVASQVGAGSTFHFTLALERTVMTHEEPAPASDAAPLPPMRILLAEDNLVNQRVARGLLERRGHSVEIASNGLEALHCCLKSQFDVVLMDVQMPEMGGREATQAIRSAESTRHTPIIGLSASALESDRRECLAAGMDDYVTKPFQTEQVLAAIARVCVPAQKL